MEDVKEGTLLWSPSPEAAAQTKMAAFRRWAAERAGQDLPDFDALWRWSVEDLEGFWQAIWDYFEVISHTPPTAALADRTMPGADWFPGATLNYAEHALRRRDDGEAVIWVREDGAQGVVTRAELAEQVARARAGLVRLGVGRGDRVCAYLPNGPEALIAFLATASLGAIWSSCAPEFGVGAVLDRFQQIEPKVLLAVDGYPYGGKFFDRREQVQAIRDGLPGLSATVLLKRTDEGLADTVPWDAFVAEAAELTFEPVSFDHPLWILYSSGTTGLPKPIVHGQGGILLEHFKALSLHGNLGEGDRFFWFSTTGWMMWNYLIGGLLVGSAIVVYEGHPAWPDLGALWRLAESTKMTYFGTSAPFLMSCRKAGLSPKDEADLSRLQGVGSTGAPLPVEGFAWVYEHVGADLVLGSVSGGTDVCTAFVLANPELPVYAGEIQCRGLGCKVEAFDANGEPVVGEVGELVITEPMPSMPVMFWNDPDGSRLKGAYFEQFPGIWRHGDWMKLTERGTLVIYGRSDSTLNRGGVRMGTSEFYRVVDRLPEIVDSLVVEPGKPGDDATELWLFVVLGEGVSLDEALEGRIRKTLRSTISPRHVPDLIQAIEAVPRTLSGKKLEVPVKRILTGTPVEKAANPDTLANPEALEPFVRLAETKATGG